MVLQILSQRAGLRVYSLGPVGPRINVADPAATRRLETEAVRATRESGRTRTNACLRGGWRYRKNAGVGRLRGGHEGVHASELVHLLLARAAEAAEGVVVVQQVEQGVSEGFRIIRWHEPATTEAIEHFRKRAVGWEHNRRARGERFKRKSPFGSR